MGGLLRRGADRRSPYVSPVFAEVSGLPPLLLLVGQDELLLDDALRVRDAAASAGTDVRVHIGKGMQHDWPLTLPWLDESRLAWSTMRNFIVERAAAIRRRHEDEREGLTVAQSTTTRTFRRLHDSGCFVIPNPWDIGSARMLAQLGFPALATTSAGFAWSLGRRDNAVSLEEALGHCRAMAASVAIPISADFEHGFAAHPDGVSANVAAAAATGIAGLSIEDSTGEASDPLFPFPLAVERIRAARRAIDDSGSGILLTARSEGFIVGRPDLEETIRRLQAFADAGADCLYAPGLRTMAEIAAVVSAVAPKPVNVLVGSDFTTVAALAQLGVRRISVGGALARAAWTGFLQAATEIAEQGTFAGLAHAVPFADLNRSFTTTRDE